MGLTREQILGAADIQTEEVHVPEWGGTVLVRGLTGAERDRFEMSMGEVTQGKRVQWRVQNIRARLCVLAIVDETGKQVFTQADVPMLTEKSAAALDRVFSVASRLSGLSDQDMEELAKNLQSGPSDDSGSD